MIHTFSTMLRNTRPARRFIGSRSFALSLVLCLSAALGSVAKAANKYPLTCKSNTVYDGKGATIKATNLQRVFNVWAVKNVTIRNFTIEGGKKTRIFDISKSDGIKIENIKIKSMAADVVHIHKSSNITINKLVADTIDRYLVWADNSDRITLRNSALTNGSKSESGVRVMDWTNNVVIEGCTINNRMNKQTSLRLHDGKNFTVRNSTFEGHVLIGPMGGSEGGQRLTNASERRTVLGKRTTNVLFENLTIYGSLSPQAGLSGFTMSGGTVTAKAGSPFFNSPFNNVTWSYPEANYYKSGDVRRPAPSGVLKNVKFIGKGRTTLNYGTNGPFQVKNCTLNGKTIR